MDRTTFQGYYRHRFIKWIELVLIRDIYLFITLITIQQDQKILITDLWTIESSLLQMIIL